jgi:hypothetical protein
MSSDLASRPRRSRRSFALGVAFLLVGVGLGMSTALAATGAAALLVRNASESAAADLSRSELVVFPSPSLPFDGGAPRAEHVDIAERSLSRAAARAEAAAQAQARTQTRRAPSPGRAALLARATAETSSTLSSLLAADARAAAAIVR